MKMLTAAAIAALGFAVAVPATVVAKGTDKAAVSQDKQKKKLCKKGKRTSFAVVNEDIGRPVFAYDITDRPYKVIGEVSAGVRKATIFSKEASQEKIYCELWEKALALDPNADAVINAKYGDSHVTAMSWGKTNATGTVVKFEPATTAQ